MLEVKLSNEALQEAGKQGFDEFLTLIVEAISKEAGGELNAESMEKLNASQITLWGYFMLRDEVMDGGFVQLIHNGYGPFFFDNPFAKILKDWGVRELGKLMFEVRKLYYKHGDDLTRECNEDEFMALFEKHPEFDEFDDEFVENEEMFTSAIACYVDDNIQEFVIVS